MTPEQFRVLVSLLERVLDRPYTLTDAADWPILIVVGSGLIALICFMWLDLRTVVKDNKTKAERDTEKLWDALRACQHECNKQRKIER